MSGQTMSAARTYGWWRSTAMAVGTTQTIECWGCLGHGYLVGDHGRLFRCYGCGGAGTCDVRSRTPIPPLARSIPSHGHVVYGLADEYGSVRYVGTTKSPRTRYTQHIRAAWYYLKDGSVFQNERLHRWIGGLLADGQAPEFLVLVDGGSYEEELMTIRALRQIGANLLNCAETGAAIAEVAA